MSCLSGELRDGCDGSVVCRAHLEPGMGLPRANPALGAMSLRLRPDCLSLGLIGRRESRSSLSHEATDNRQQADNR